MAIITGTKEMPTGDGNPTAGDAINALYFAIAPFKAQIGKQV